MFKRLLVLVSKRLLVLDVVKMVGSYVSVFKRLLVLVSKMVLVLCV